MGRSGNVDKTELRKRMRAVRAALSAEERRQRSEKVCARVIEGLIKPRMADWALVAAFIPVGTEIDVMPILRWCWAQRIAVAAPRVDRAAGVMTLHRVAGEEELQPGAYGIREPMPHAPPLAALPEGTLMLVPGLAFDAAGRRLGYGGGYYDRLLEQHRAALRSGALTLAAPIFAAQLVDVVPTEPHDVRVRFLITEAEMIDCTLNQSEESPWTSRS